MKNKVRQAAWPAHGGELGRMIGSFGWEKTELGPIDAWPQRIKAVIDIMLASGFPMSLNLGRRGIHLYNKPFSALIGDRHPSALGRSVFETYVESRSSFAPIFERIWRGETVTLYDKHFLLLRNKKLEDTWFTVTYVPARDDADEIAGVFATMIETTERIKSQRWRAQLEAELREREARQAFLLKLSDRIRRAWRADDVTAAASELLGRYLGVSGVSYSETDPDTGMAHVANDWSDGSIPTMSGLHRLSDFGQPLAEELLAGNTIYVEDSLIDARTSGDGVAQTYAALGGLRAGAAVPLIKNHRVVGSLAVYQTTPRQWREDELWLIEEVAERTWSAVQQVRAETALRANEERYRRLFNAIDEGFCIIQVIFDAAGKPIDYRFLETNPAFVGATGLHDAIGKRMRELAPNHEQHWFDIYGRIALSGDPERFTNQAKQLDGRWYDVFAFRVGQPEERKVGVLFKDITAQRRVETALRDSEARQTFLLALGDAFKECTEASAIMSVTAEHLGRYLNADRAGYAEIDSSGEILTIRGDWTQRGAPSLNGRHRLNDMGPLGTELRAGRTIAVENIADYPLPPDDEKTLTHFRAVDLHAGIGTPVFKQGRLEAIVFAHSCRPRRWTQQEVALVNEVAERTWDAIQRARAERALRDSEQRLTTILNLLPVGIGMFDAKGCYTLVNPALGRPVGSRIPLYDTDVRRKLSASDSEGRPLSTDQFPSARVLRGEDASMPTLFRMIGPNERLRWNRVAAVPVRNAAGEVAGGIIMVEDITQEFLAQQSIREREAHEAFMLRLADRLRHLTEATEITGAAAEELGRHLRATHVAYGEIEANDEYGWISSDWTDGTTQSAVGRYRLDYFGLALVRSLREGKVWRSNDMLVDDRINPMAYERTHRAFGTRALLIVPLIKAGRLVANLSIGSAQPREWTDAEVNLLREVGERTWDALERARAEAALAASERRLSTLVQGIPQLVWCAVDSGHWVWSSAQWSAYTGLAAEQSRDLGWLYAVHPDDRDEALRAWSHAAETQGFEADYRLCHAAEGRYRWFQTRATPVRDLEGRVIEWLGTSTDVDELRQLQEEQKVMLGELQHRTRNLITVIRAIATQTLKSSDSMPSFETRFNARLGALSRVQGLLSNIDQTVITIGILIRMELSALGIEEMTDRVQVAGPEIPLRSSSVQTLALAVHELATNARKYGALANDQGKLSVTWQVKENERMGRDLQLEWVEETPDLQHAAPIERYGYGRQLIERALPYALGAKTAYELTPTGVRCSIEIPLGKQDMLDS